MWYKLLKPTYQCNWIIFDDFISDWKCQNKLFDSSHFDLGFHSPKKTYNCDCNCQWLLDPCQNFYLFLQLHLQGWNAEKEESCQAFLFLTSGRWKKKILTSVRALLNPPETRILTWAATPNQNYDVSTQPWQCKKDMDLPNIWRDGAESNKILQAVPGSMSWSQYFQRFFS
jgi:hypothetical protein